VVTSSLSSNATQTLLKELFSRFRCVEVPEGNEIRASFKPALNSFAIHQTCIPSLNRGKVFQDNPMTFMPEHPTQYRDVRDTVITG
jgi:hypothetical protein